MFGRKGKLEKYKVLIDEYNGLVGKIGDVKQKLESIQPADGVELEKKGKYQKILNLREDIVCSLKDELNYDYNHLKSPVRGTIGMIQGFYYSDDSLERRKKGVEEFYHILKEIENWLQIKEKEEPLPLG